jgi:DNA processing protein
MHSEQFRKEYWACLALAHCKRLGAKTWKRLIDQFGSAYEAVQRVDEWTGSKLANKAHVQTFRQEEWRVTAKEEWKRVLGQKINVLLCTDPRYPKRLWEIPDPPLCLYYAGDCSLLQQPCVAMVGARECSQYGLEAARDLARELSKSGITVVSGFAWGIDRHSQLSALKAPGRSIAVLGTGLDIIYPRVNKDLWSALLDTGLIVTEFPPGTNPDPGNFPRRNRIISGLSLGVVVIEAAQQSGSLITARLALEQNREVFAVPGPLNAHTSCGCNDLIRKGAVLVRSAQDILEELASVLGQEFLAAMDLQFANEQGENVHKEEPRFSEQGLDPEEISLCRCLQTESKLHIDSLTEQLGWETSQVSRVLLELEIRGVVKQLSGMYYSLT